MALHSRCVMRRQQDRERSIALAGVETGLVQADLDRSLHPPR